MENIFDKVTDELQLNRSDWKLVKFGEIAFQQKQSVDRDNTELTRYVKGEHMGSEDLHLREWGELTDEYLGPAFIRKFETGDILYGSRRTYLRKVVIAPFEGITSNTTFVIKANEKKIDKRLLPFIMLSEGFAENSIKNSKGSVNPYINWKDISEYEFLLPPKDQQAQLAELLWAMDVVIEKEMDTLEKAKKMEWVFIVEEYSSKEGEWTLNELTNEKYGIVDGPFGSNLKTIHYRDEGILVMQSGYVTKGYFEITQPIYVSEEKYREQIRSSAISGDILMAKIGANYGECALIPSGFERTLIAGNAIRIRVNEKKCLVKYMLLFLKYLKRKGEFEKHVTTTAQPALTISALKQLKMYLPTLGDQENYIERFNSISDSISKLESKIACSKALQKSLINQIF